MKSDQYGTTVERRTMVQYLYCTACSEPIVTGQRRRSKPEGTFHETCITPIGKEEVLVCHECEDTYTATYVRDCPACGSARTSKGEPDSYGGIKHV